MMRPWHMKGAKAMPKSNTTVNLEKHLLGRFQADVNGIVDTMKKAEADVKTRMARLKELYGDDIVDFIPPMTVSVGAVANGQVAKATLLPAAPAKRRKRRRQKRV